MGNESFFGKIRKVLEKPQAPAYIQQRYDMEIPWYRRAWYAIRPPAAMPTERVPMSPAQRRILWITLSALAPMAIAGGIYYRISSAPQRARDAYDAGMRRLGPADFPGAVEYFTTSISISETGLAYLQRANAYKNLSQPEKALADWSRAIELDPTLADAFTARGTYYQSIGDTAKSLADLDRSIELNPTVDGFFQRGQVHAERGEYQAAIRDFDEAIFERREAPYVYLARSMAKRALGDEEGYKQDQSKALSIINAR